jgi:PQQ-dependent dehydrogenase (methanol/ethanol family)
MLRASLYRILSLALPCALTIVSSGCTGGEAASSARAEPGMAAPPANGSIRLVSPVPNGQWRLPGGDLANTRYSPLNQITTENVARLQVKTTLSTGIPHGHEGGPLVVDNTMYIVTPFPNNLIAVDLTQPGGALKWIFQPNPDPQSVGKACCDVVNRGASYADGKVIYNTLDAHTVAVDVKTGKQAWRTQLGDIQKGETLTMAPLVVKDKVIVGNSGGEMGVRGWVQALAVKDGHAVWKAYNTGPDKDVLIGSGFKAFYPKDQGVDLGVKTWPPDQWKLGGSNVWGWISYDPGLDLIYYGTGNPGVWNPDMRPGANKWSTAVIARNPDTGMAKWAYQYTEHDAWDYDEIMENILVDMELGGRVRKLLIHPGRTGFVYVQDRETGELLSAEVFVPSTNWATGYDLATGKAHEVAAKRTHMGRVTKDICPSSTGAKDFTPSAFSPRTGLLYIPAHNTCMDYEGIEANYIAGTPYLGASVKMYPGPGGYQGELVAWDVAHAKRAWSVQEPILPVYSGVLATGGDVVFYGTLDGWFKALDARNGKELWKFKTGSGIVGNPITYLGPDGKQYVAVYSGVGGWMGAVAFPSMSTDDPYAGLGVVGAMAPIKHYTGPGDVLYVFGF